MRTVCSGGGDREDVALSYSKLDAERSRELLGLQYDVPWSVWGGQWASSTDTLTGMLVKYRQRKFLLKFPHANNTEPVWLTWGQVLGEQALCGAVFLRPHETVTAPVIDGTTHRDFKKRGVVRYPSPTLGRLPLPISLHSPSPILAAEDMSTLNSARRQQFFSERRRALVIFPPASAPLGVLELGTWCHLVPIGAGERP